MFLGAEVNGGDFDFLQTTYWDPQKPHVLRWKGVDLERANPKQWTRTCQFFLDKDTEQKGNSKPQFISICISLKLPTVCAFCII